jgi:site-specific DNA-cytosine methylase
MANTLTTSCNQGVVVSEPKAVSYTRDSKGKTQNKHLNEIVNKIHSSTGSGGNTDCFVAEPQVQQIDNLVVEPLNPYKDGTCRTIKAQYQQSSRANFTRQDGLGATGVVQIGNIYPDTDNFKNKTSGRVNSAERLSPTLRTVTGGHNEPKVVEEKQPRYRIRKLTPRECFRLMDVDEVVIDKIQAAGISNSQQYKLAGNSIVVACLEKIFEQMFFPQYTNTRTLFG